MKEKYEAPVAEIIEFDAEDVIITSAGQGGSEMGGEGGNGEGGSGEGSGGGGDVGGGGGEF